MLSKLAAVLVLAFGCLALAADDEEVKQLPDGPGKDLVARACFECHGAGNFRKRRLDRDAWEEQVADMVDRGAKANEAESSKIVDYLAQNFGKDSKIYINTAPLVELKAVLDLSVKDAQAILDYRQANGKFEKLADLQKIPGIDGAKIEAKKDSIAF
ncbi:MAG TPA: helix-hairpin-helix domain-containing protein [Bryobacteraceae bacterium]|nr:helix-hairpin-helix domain-containing protein [Bryobacteraceae bacterium]